MKERMGRRSLRTLVLASAGAISIGAIAVPGLAAEPSGPSNCPDILPVDDVTDGMLATGWTAVDSETPQSFGVEVLGVLENGVAPGRDMIVVEVSGPVIGQNGNGIWAGMSGSPVYHDGDLIGAVAYGLSYGPSRVGGLTPAEDMANVPHGTDATSASTQDASTVPLSHSERADIADETGSSTQQVGESFVQLKTPFSIGGASPRSFRKVAKAIEREELPFIPYAGGTTGSGELDTTDDPPSAGQSFAAALSYGDITFAGVGTTTMRCQGRVLAFGHPFMWTGDAAWGASTAEALTVVPDRVYGSYKLANIDETFGLVEQDRLAAIGADVGTIPEVLPVNSTMTDLNLNDTREGTTLAVDSEYVPYITMIHLLSNADSTVDRIGKGSSSSSWTISGKREDGDDWSVSRTNRQASEYDISYTSLFEIENALYSIIFNRFEEVELTDIEFEGEFEKDVKKFHIERALISRNGAPFHSVRKIAVRPGDQLRVKVQMTDMDENVKNVIRSFNVPNRFRDAHIEVTGGGSDYGYFECFTEFDDCADKGKPSFDTILDRIESKPKNNDLVMSFRARQKRQRHVVTQDQVVGGRDFIRIVRKGSGGSGDDSGGSAYPGKG